MVKFLNTEFNRLQLAQYEKIYAMKKDAKPISEINVEWRHFIKEIIEGLPSIPPVSADQQIDAIDEMIRKWDAELATAGDDAQLANIDLQNQLQKQQQTLQLMSNVSKMLHDSALDVIRNIG